MTTTDLETKLSARLGYKAVKTNSFTVHTNYNGYAEFYQKNETYNFIAHDLSLPTNYYLSSMRFQLIPLYSYQELDGNAYINSKGALAKGTKRFDNIDISLLYSFYKIASMDNYYDYLEGDSTTLGISALMVFNSGEFNLSYNVMRSDNTDSLENIASYDGYKVAFSYYHTTNSYSWYLSATIAERDYKINPTTQILRSDKENLFTIRPTYYISSNLSIYWDNKLSKVDSNESNLSYDQFVSLTGFNWYIW